MSAGRLRIAWFSDLSIGKPASLSAYCSRELLGRIANEHSIELFSESFSRSELELPHHHYLKAYKRHEEQPFDLFFYQLEDGRACRFVRGHIGLIPGVVWIHDLFCKDLGPEACHTSPWENTINQFFDRSKPFADRSVAPHQLWPKVYREASLSPVVLFSSRWAHSEFLRMTSNRLEPYPGGHIAEIVPVPINSPSGETRRGAVPSKVFSIACNSVTGIEGRAHKFLPVLRSLHNEWRLVWMLDPEEVAAAQGLVREFGIADDRVIFQTPRSPETWVDILVESDLALHLHTSTFGHLSPYIQSTLAHGCPALVAQAAQGEDLPSNVAFHIVAGVHESTQIKAAIEAVLEHGRAMLGRAGADYILASAGSAQVAGRLSQGFRRWATQLAPVMQRWQELQKRAKTELLEEVHGLVRSKADTTLDPYEIALSPALQELGWK